jgi:hypothetical protein
MDARLMDAIVKTETRFLPALAEQIAIWFPELGGRSLAVSDANITKENVPTLPLCMVAFARGTGDPPARTNTDIFDATDTFVVEFWLEPSRYKKSNGSETPFWSYYDYEAIRDTLLSHVAFWETPGGERIGYRNLTIEADALAVTLTFGFVATYRWCAAPPPKPDCIITKPIGFRLCTPPAECCLPECFDDPPKDDDLCHPCK